MWTRPRPRTRGLSPGQRSKPQDRRQPTVSRQDQAPDDRASEASARVNTTRSTQSEPQTFSPDGHQENPVRPPSRLVGSNVVAHRLGVHVRTVDAWATRGMLPGFKVGKLWRFDSVAIEEIIRRQRSLRGE
jgi:excisionase family DNA binding protein